jgi:hypothetical protein
VKAFAIAMHTDPFVNGILDPQVPVLWTTAVAYLGIYFERARARACVCVLWKGSIFQYQLPQSILNYSGHSGRTV